MQDYVGLQDPAICLLEGRTTLHVLLVPWMRQRTVSALQGVRSEFGWGGGGDPKSGAAQRAVGSGTEGCAAVSRGHTKITKTGRRNNDDNGGGDDRRDGGRRGACRGSAIVRAHRGGTADQGGMGRLGVIQ